MKKEPPDMEHVQKCLGWKPIPLCEKTLEVTTQYAKNHLHLPLRDHFKARFPALNCKRLNEIYSTDTFFASSKALGGYTCAQLYVGKTSMLTEAFGMKSENEMKDTLQDFIRKWGAPHSLLSNNAKSEIGNAVREILRAYNIKDLQTEPHHPNQNPAERRIQEVKKMVNWILDHTGAPECLWYLCLQYSCYLLNRLSHTQLNNCTPYKKAIGDTPDISALLQFHFYQPILYYDKTASFPSTKEHLGWWVGIAETQGDALTYKILTIDNDVITRSVVRPADHPIHPNKQVRFKDEVDHGGVLESEADVIDIEKLSLPTVDPADIIGTKFIKEIHGHPHKCEVTEALDDAKYLVKVGDGQREEILTYN